jgi:nitrogenase molybdenum-iron protein NifN
MLPMLHGSQGCATYIRRYLISHFREPIDIASSNFSEETTIFGGNKNFNTGIDNIISQYHPKVIAIASTCLSETIGEDVQRLVYEYRMVHEGDDNLPEMFYASTPSYRGTHDAGFHEAVLAAVRSLARADGMVGRHVNLFCNFISPADIRHLREIVADFGIDAMIFPDYSDTLDGVSWDEYQRIPEGGTPLDMLRNSGLATLSIELGYILNSGGYSGRIKNSVTAQSAGKYLNTTFDVPYKPVGLPTGITETDKFFDLLSIVSGKPVPPKYVRQRGRLLDMYIDGHKYVSGKRVVVYGEEDLVVALTVFVSEIGMKPTLCATGGESGKLADTLKSALGRLYSDDVVAKQGMTFDQIETAIADDPRKPDLMLGNSKGYYIARKFDIPLVRTGFPIHDRIGAQHKRILGYEGTTFLFEEIVNALMDYKQRNSLVGYKYM